MIKNKYKSLRFSIFITRYLQFFIFIFSIYNTFLLNAVFSQSKHNSYNSDSSKTINKNYTYLDSLKLVIAEVVIMGNDVTDDEIILREMQLRKGNVFTSEKCEEDRLRINNLGLFVRTEITPDLKPENKLLLKVNVQEKWYIYPMPSAGSVDGDIRKIWVGASIRWQNFRGRNENVMLNFGVGYNPFIHASYTVPWIGKDLHLFSSISGGYSKDRNRSQLALGRTNGSTQLNYRDFNNNNFDYYNYNAKLTVGKYFSKHFSIFTDAGYNILQVTQYGTGRTVSPDGTDRYLTLGFGINYDSRNDREFTTKGYLLRANYEYYGLLNNAVNFGRLNLLQQDFIPVNIKKDYSIVLTSRINTSLASGSTIPYYDHRYIGSRGDIVRGWYFFSFEGDNSFTLNNEIWIPIIQPNYFEGSEIPVIKKIKYLKNYSYKYGLFFTMFYDVGTIWNVGDAFQNMKFLNGTGIGLNAILPFGMAAKIEWAFRLGTPTAGQIIFGLGGRF